MHIALTHICYNFQAVSMTSLEAIKKRVPIRPALPYNFKEGTALLVQTEHCFQRGF